MCVMWCADASSMVLVAEQQSAHSGWVNSVGFSSDGTRIVSGSAGLSGDPGSVKVWGECRSLALCYRMLAVAADVQWAVADGACALA